MKSNKSLIVLTCVLVIALVSGAGAHTTWGSFYVGGSIGNAVPSSDVHTTTVFSPTGYFATSSVPAIAAVGAQTLSSLAFTSGIQAGYNYQIGSIVIGLETEFASMSRSDTVSASEIYPCCAPTDFTVAQKVENSWLITIRPRVGYAAGPFLVYGTGGIAIADLDYAERFTDTFADARESGSFEETVTGWTLGIGGEWRFAAAHWSLKGEYLYADFGEGKATSDNFYGFRPPIYFPTNVFTHTADLTSHVVRFGVNYAF